MLTECPHCKAQISIKPRTADEYEVIAWPPPQPQGVWLKAGDRADVDSNTARGIEPPMVTSYVDPDSGYVLVVHVDGSTDWMTSPEVWRRHNPSDPPEGVPVLGYDPKKAKDAEA